MASPDARYWTLDPSIDHLNHGSFGACPSVVLEAQRAWRDRMEADPLEFLDRELPDLLASAHADLGRFVGADADDLAFVPNATTGVNTVLRSLHFAPGDELLTTDHEYNATLNAIRDIAARDGARVVVARIPFPIASPGDVLDAVIGAVTPRTRLALISHVTSPTALLFPVAELVHELDARGVDTLLDAAHAPGMAPLDLRAIGAAYATANAHKWLCSPKGSAFLHVRRDRRDAIRPLVVSHSANEGRPGRDVFRDAFEWTGTFDPSAWLAIPAALRFLEEVRPGGVAAVMAANHALAIEGRDLVADALGVDPPAPDAMLGSMATLPLPDDLPDDLQRRLRDDHRIEIPVLPWPVEAAIEADGIGPARLIRLSAQLYNDRGQYERLAGALSALRGAPQAMRSATAE